MTKRTSPYYVCSLDVNSAVDMEKLEIVKKTVKASNKYTAVKHRVVVKGRKPIVKQHNSRTGNMVSYDTFGDIVGGLQNASVLDVYVFQRR